MAFPLVIATDGSAQARAAVREAALFPWPAGARPRVVVAGGGVVAARWPVPVLAAFSRGMQRVALEASRALKSRWPRVEVAVVDQPPVAAILAEARKVRAKAIVLGSRGQGALGRSMLGSVSRGVVRGARCAVLVVKGRSRAVLRVVIGLDGSLHSRRAVSFVAGLPRPPRGRVTLARVIEPVRLPSMGLLPASVRAAVAAQAKALEGERLREARRDLEAAAGMLKGAGWAVAMEVRAGAPVPGILTAARAARADLVVVGARGAGGFERLLLGSVAEGALARSPVSVLIVR